MDRDKRNLDVTFVAKQATLKENALKGQEQTTCKKNNKKTISSTERRKLGRIRACFGLARQF